MNRLDFICDHWIEDENAPRKSNSRMLMLNYREKEEPCIHLRGRGWRWVTLKCTYPKLAMDEDYELYLWAKIDFYSENGSQCFIELLAIPYERATATYLDYWNIIRNKNGTYSASYGVA